MEEQLNELESQTLETGEEDTTLDDAALAAESEESDESSEEEQADDVDSLKAQVAKLKKTNQQLYKRVKESKNKTDKSATNSDNKPSKPSTQKSGQGLSEDEIVFLAGGGSKEELGTIRMLMKHKSISFDEARKDPIYEAVVKQNEAKKKSEEAALGSSSPGRKKPKETLFKPGMTKAQHKEAWLKSRGQ